MNRKDHMFSKLNGTLQLMWYFSTLATFVDNWYQPRNLVRYGIYCTSFAFDLFGYLCKIILFLHLSALTEDGHETQFQVNHLSHFLLTLELLPIMLDTASTTGDGRIVIVSSAGHRSGVFDPDNLDGQQSYGRMKFYCHSKLYNVQFVASCITIDMRNIIFKFQVMTAYALQRRLQNVGITVSSLHPGFVSGWYMLTADNVWHCVLPSGQDYSWLPAYWQWV